MPFLPFTQGALARRATYGYGMQLKLALPYSIRVIMIARSQSIITRQVDV